MRWRDVDSGSDGEWEVGSLSGGVDVEKNKGGVER